MCGECFEALKLDPKLLDKHDHAPFSPQNKVPFHPYTQKWAISRKLVLDDPEESSEWEPSDDEKKQDDDESSAEEQTDKSNQETPAVEQTDETPAVEQTDESNQVNVSGVIVM